MKITRTERGFKIAEFTDLYGKNCSIQESSLATDYAIWLGRGKKRMHLNQKQVAELLPLLNHFIMTGDLPNS